MQQSSAPSAKSGILRRSRSRQNWPTGGRSWTEGVGWTRGGKTSGIPYSTIRALVDKYSEVCIMDAAMELTPAATREHILRSYTGVASGTRRLVYLEGLDEVISRLQAIGSGFKTIVAKLKKADMAIAKAIIPQLKIIARHIMRMAVYDKPVTVRELTGTISWSEPDSESDIQSGQFKQSAISKDIEKMRKEEPTKYEKLSKILGISSTAGGYIRTMNLMQAVLEGIVQTSTGINLRIREDVAPYWPFVHYGHRVWIMTRGYTGRFVEGRPWQKDIHVAAKKLTKDAVIGTAVKVIRDEIKVIRSKK